MKVTHVFLILFALFVCWRGFLYLEKTQKEKKQETAATEIKEENLPGMPYQLQASYDAARTRGPTAVRDWLKAYGHVIHDPRKGWIELQYCISIVRDNPAEARRIFVEIKKRTQQSSPIWPTLRKYEKTFE
jgi:hypothetical protein